MDQTLGQALDSVAIVQEWQVARRVHTIVMKSAECITLREIYYAFCLSMIA